MTRRLLLAISGVALLAAALAQQPAGAADTPAAHETAPVPTVGTLFYPSVLGLFATLRLPHFCSASVVHSTGHDLVITAAHCVYGTGPTIEFAPGYDDGATPYGVWTVRHLYVDPAWKATRDPRHDVFRAVVRPDKAGLFYHIRITVQIVIERGWTKMRKGDRRRQFVQDTLHVVSADQNPRTFF